MARLAPLGLLVAGAMAALASSAMADTPSCVPATLTQPFLNWNDSNWYTAAPGVSPDNFDGTDWTLLGGASVVSTDLADGTTGNVLDLSGRSMAISPTMCIDLTYQTARAMVRHLSGHGALSVAVSYQDASTGEWSRFEFGGVLTGDEDWAPSRPVDLMPDTSSGPQMVRFAFGSVGRHTHAQLYNFYVDPYAKG
jgi:hypothetical protein